MKYRHTHLLLLCSYLLTLIFSCGQLWAQRKVLRVMSYNVENFFDTEDDPTHDDDSFLPTGVHHWTRARYQEKIQHIAQVISTVGDEAFPDLIALTEIENATVLSDLIHRTALGEKMNYRYVLTHGEDKRGINVALLYSPSTFRLIATEEIPVHFPFDSLRRTRALLRVTGQVPSGDTLHLFVCHLPSRRGGALSTARYRDYCCSLLRTQVDSLMRRGGSQTHCLLLGDFNGDPEEAATTEALHSLLYTAETPINLLPPAQLLALLHRGIKQEAPGSYCYQGVWSQLDQAHLTASLLQRQGGGHLHYVAGSTTTVVRPFYTSRLSGNGMLVPWRSYGGTFYRGGYSDHFPIRLLLAWE